MGGGTEKNRLHGRGMPRRKPIARVYQNGMKKNWLRKSQTKELPGVDDVGGKKEGEKGNT